MKSISTRTSTTVSWMKSNLCLFSSQGLPYSSSKASLNSFMRPASVSCCSRSARCGSDPQKPCISLKTRRKTFTIASLFCLLPVSLLESILKSTTSIGVSAASFMSASTIGSIIFLSSTKKSSARRSPTCLFSRR